jgi:hypothetical protein
LKRKKNIGFSLFFRTSVKAAFLSVPRKYQLDTSMIRLNSGDCSNEISDDMLPWLPEDFYEDSTIVTIQ